MRLDVVIQVVCSTVAYQSLGLRTLLLCPSNGNLTLVIIVKSWRQRKDEPLNEGRYLNIIPEPAAGI
jgi:hypothetical protein